MDNYQNVDVDKLANIYFEGKVISRNIFFKDGSKKTLGIMLVGEYEFKTISREVMEIISGELNFNTGSESAATVLYARYLKRIGSHLKNITTTVINPIDSIGYQSKGIST